VEIEDDGEGIPEANLPRIFDPFFTTKEVGRGTGLGLYVSYEIMKNLGGDIDVRSQVGRGTRVTVLLPPDERPSETRA
jgi:two-component system NtrC family sensor kinase